MLPGNSSDRLPLQFVIRRKHHLHRKTQILSVSLKSKSFLISQGRIRNVFLTKMDALLPVTDFNGSLSVLLSCL